MSKKITMSLQTRANWLIDLMVLLGGLLASLALGMASCLVPAWRSVRRGVAEGLRGHRQC